MLHRTIYQRDPLTRKLVNEGVANVNYDMSSQALSVLDMSLKHSSVMASMKRAWSTSLRRS